MGWQRWLPAVCASTAFVLGLAPATSMAQDAPADGAPTWSFLAQASLYMLPDDTFVMPVVGANHGALHLEGRYNYEDRDTFSAWAGWTFEWGEKVRLSLVPMLGLVLGQTNGFAPGLEGTLEWKRLTLYSESEYVFDWGGHEGDFFYDWTQLDCALTRGLQAGFAVQRSRAYESEFEFARGPYIAWEQGRAELSLYGFNFDGEDPFAVLALAVGF